MFEKQPRRMDVTTKENEKSALKSAENEPAPHDEIAKRAFELYMARGCTPGSHEEDWFQAEHEVNTRQTAEMKKPGPVRSN